MKHKGLLYLGISFFMLWSFLPAANAGVVRIDSKITVGGTLPIPPDYPAKTALYRPGLPIRAEFDWRNHNGHNWITEPKDQGGCGDCWAFAAAGAFEAQYRITNNNPAVTWDLSERFESACYTSIAPYLFPRCDWGWYTEIALDHMADVSSPYVVGETGICTEVCYPYGDMISGFNPSGCGPADNPTPCPTYLTERVYLDSWAELWPAGSPPGNPDEVIKTFVSTHGPVIVRMALIGVETDPLPNDDWYDFIVDFWYDPDPTTVWTGVDGSCDSNPDCSGHSVLIVGYNDSATEPYWIVKNSWGSFQKDNGFFRMAMGYNNSGIYYHPIIVNTSADPTTPTTSEWGLIILLIAFSGLLTGILLRRN